MEKEARAISHTLSKGEGEVHGHEKASKRLASLQAMRPGMARRDAAPPPDLTRDKVREIARRAFEMQPALVVYVRMGVIPEVRSGPTVAFGPHLPLVTRKQPGFHWGVHSLTLQPRAPDQCRYDPWPQSLLVSTNGSVLPHYTALAT